MPEQQFSLYAAGNASAAVMGHSYAGAGSTIGRP
jgi:3-oxosteroid 1-dehydrogenase